MNTPTVQPSSYSGAPFSRYDHQSLYWLWMGDRKVALVAFFKFSAGLNSVDPRPQAVVGPISAADVHFIVPNLDLRLTFSFQRPPSLRTSLSCRSTGACDA